MAARLSDDGLHPGDVVQAVHVGGIGAGTAPNEVGLTIVSSDVVAALVTEDLVLA